jgi:group II intron reverse transcriptase/maturase
METKLDRIAEISSKDAKSCFTSIYHLLNKELLLQCHKELSKNKATGIDGMTKAEYEKDLDRNIQDLLKRLKNKSYKPLPTLRTYIPKSNGKQRPLGISCYEDKIVQLALKKLMEAIYEPRFLDAMYGFRPKRGCHDALKALNWAIESNYTNWVLDADIRGFFDHIDQELLMKCIEIRVKDPNILWLVKKFLKAGLMEHNVYQATDEGVAQGSNLSPLLANIYMNYMLVLWFYQEVKASMKGQALLIVYADDFVCGFQNKWEAERFHQLLKDRLARFGLELEESKSRLIEFGRFAVDNAKPSKPETFDFLGFTHYCSKSQKGYFRVKRKTSKKKYHEKVRNFKVWMKANRTLPLKELMKTVKAKLIGHYNYYGITDNYPKTKQYFYEVQRQLLKWLNRRSQRCSYTIQGFNDMLKYYPLPTPSIRVNIYEKSM